MPRHGSRTDRTCEQCGRTFSVPTKHLEWRPARWCSQVCHGAARKMPLAERFKQFVGPPTERGCLPWTGGKDGRGYGSFTMKMPGKGKIPQRAHRIAWEIAHGQPPPDDLAVLHSCDNPPCVNPDHLFLGTALDNSLDMVGKDRCWKAKVTVAQVRLIRERYRLGADKKQLMKDFGLKKHAMNKLLAGRTWAGV